MYFQFLARILTCFRGLTNICFDLQIIPQLVAGKHVMIAAHGNSLRSIIMHLDKLTSQEVI
jgi:bisphosphoglycerate-dependent phosphoglycerate mutase